MSTSARKPNYTLPIIVMFFLFAMIAFVTGFQNPFGVILKAQLGLNNFQSQIGAYANFAAYAIMGIPAGILLQKRGYKFSAISAVLVGLLGVAIMFASSYLESNNAIFTVYTIGALIGGFSMCMLNTVVNPMLNTLGGGGNKGNQLIQFGGTCNSLAATICPIFVGILIGNVSAETSLIDARPALYVAGGIFLLAFVVLALAKLPEPILEEQKAKKAAGVVEEKPSLAGALGFRHYILGALAIFLYIGIEIGVPQIANPFMTAPTMEQAQAKVDEYNAHLAQLAAVDPVAAQVANEIVEYQGNVEAAEALNPIEEAFATASEAMVDPATVGMETAAAEMAGCDHACGKADCEAPCEEPCNDACGKAACEKAGDKACEHAHACGKHACEKETACEKACDIECDEAAVTPAEIVAAKAIVDGEAPAGLGMSAALAGGLIGMYWFMMLIGRLIGGVIGGKVSARTMLIFVSALAIILLMLAIFCDTAITVPVPGFSSDGGTLSFGMFDAPINMLFLVLCGLCTSVMWGGIFNLAVEGLGKYTAVASGFFMCMVCGGAFVLPLQATISDNFGYLASYWVLVACAAYLLFYALVGSKVTKRAE